MMGDNSSVAGKASRLQLGREEVAKLNLPQFNHEMEVHFRTKFSTSGSSDKVPCNIVWHLNKTGDKVDVFGLAMDQYCKMESINRSWSDLNGNQGRKVTLDQHHVNVNIHNTGTVMVQGEPTCVAWVKNEYKKVEELYIQLLSVHLDKSSNITVARDETEQTESENTKLWKTMDSESDTPVEKNEGHLRSNEHISVSSDIERKLSALEKYIPSLNSEMNTTMDAMQTALSKLENSNKYQETIRHKDREIQELLKENVELKLKLQEKSNGEKDEISELRLEISNLKSQNVEFERLLISMEKAQSTNQERMEAELQRMSSNNKIYEKISTNLKLHNREGSDNDNDDSPNEGEQKIDVSGQDNILSNFYLMNIKFKGKEYHSVEQAYQFAKACHVKNTDIGKDIMDAQTASQCKEAAKKLPHSKSWQKKKVSVIEKLMNIKCNDSEDFREALLATGDKEITHNVGGPFWGTPGKNQFGLILMDIRSELQSESEESDLESTQESNSGDDTSSCKSEDNGSESDSSMTLNIHSNTDALFLGDSVTKHVDRKTLFGKDKVFIKPIKTVQELESAAKQVQKNTRVKYAIVHVGVNNIKNKEKSKDIARSLKSSMTILQEKLPKAEIEFSSIILKGGNEKADEVNRELQSFCRKKKLKYADHKHLTQNGSMFDDKYHITKRGTKILVRDLYNGFGWEKKHK